MRLVFFGPSILTILLLCGRTDAQIEDSTVVSIQPVKTLVSDSLWFDNWPRISPNGQQLVFTRIDKERKTKACLWTLNLSSGQLDQITPKDYKFHSTRPDWSRDGLFIVFRASDKFLKSKGTIWQMTISGQELKQLTNPKLYDDYYPHWSYDAEWIYVSRRNHVANTSVDIWRIKPTGKEKQITYHSTYDVYGSVSPDHRYLSFNSDRSGNRNIWILEVSKGEESAFQFTHSGGRGASWSPDGQWLAYHPPPSVLNGPIYIRRIDGGPRIQITNPQNGDLHGHPHWSPDGTFIIFDQRDQAGTRSEILMVDVTAIIHK